MNSVVLYLIKIIICSSVFFLYYLLALRNKSFHPYNRFYLLISSALSWTLPLLHVSMFDMQSNNEKMLKLMQLMYGGSLPDVTVGAPQTFKLTSPILLLSISAIVTIPLLVLIIVRVYKIYQLKKLFPFTKIEDVDFVHTDIDNAPFSFMRNLFWRNDIELENETGIQILHHEMAHIRQKHSWDKLYFQVLRAVFWMNPIFYFMEKELLLIHEFIADQKAVKDKDGDAFARMLLMTQMGKFVFEPAHPFFYSTIKKRLMMITNSHKPKYSYLRRLMVLPLLGCVTFAFAFRAHRSAMKDQSNAIDKMITTFKAQQKAFIVQDTSMKNSKHSDTFHLSLITQNENISDNGNTKNSIFFNVDSAPKESVSHTYSIENNQPLYVVNGKISSTKSLGKISADNIESVTVLKDAPAESLYGKDAKNGVVIITTKNKNQSLIQQKDSIKLKLSSEKVIINDIDNNNTQATLTASTATINLQNPKPIIYINGKKADENSLHNLDINSIKKISVYKDNNKEYGNQGKSGVIDITTNDTRSHVFARTTNKNNDAYLPVEILNTINLTRDTTQKRNYEFKFTSVQHEAIFPGGAEAWAQYLKNNLKSNIPIDNGAPAGSYPITVSFLVDRKGNISEVKAVSYLKPDYGTAAEAVRVIAASGPWIPAKQNGHTVTYRQKQRIIFTVQK